MDIDYDDDIVPENPSGSGKLLNDLNCMYSAKAESTDNTIKKEIFLHKALYCLNEISLNCLDLMNATRRSKNW